MNSRFSFANHFALTACLAGISVAVKAEPWTPAQLTTELWLDAADATTITVDEFDRVSQWNDKSGNVRHVTQSRSDRRPAYGATGWGGALPELQFSSYGAQKDTLGRDVSGDGISGSAYTLFVVVDAQSEDGEEWIHNANTTQTHPAPGSENRHQINNNGVKVRADSNNGGTASGAYIAGQQILQFTLDDMASEVLRNGVQIAANSGTFTPYALSGDYAVNGRNSRDGHAGMTGSVAEWIYLAENPSTENRQLVEGYLAHKWGLAGDLPSDHPYKNAAPGTGGLGFAVTTIDYNPDAAPNPTVTLTWRKTGAASYIARISRDLSDWGEDLDDSITPDRDENTGDAEQMTVTFELTGGLENDPDLFFRIEEG